jgi:hypothetical protein
VSRGNHSDNNLVKPPHGLADREGMRPRLYLHRSRVYALEPPGLGPPLIGFLVGLMLAILFGGAAALTQAGGLPRHAMSLPWKGHDEVRWFVFVVGGVNCFLSVLVASGYGIRLLAILSHRMGWHPIMESEGPCRLVQDEPGLWGLQMELSSGADPGVAWPLTPARLPPVSCHLFFRLDEGAAGAVSHLTSPDESLVVRWLDLPIAFGGPTLLEVRSPVREEQTDDVTVEIRHAA